MRTINIVEVKNGTVNNIESFGIYEDQFSNEIIEKAEEVFSNKCLEYGAKEKRLFDYIEDGFYEGGNFSINLVWSNI